MLFVFEKNFDEVLRKLQNDLLILDEWVFNNFLVLNPKKYHFMSLATPNKLSNFKCNDIIFKNNFFENLLGVTIDNKLDFMSS